MRSRILLLAALCSFASFCWVGCEQAPPAIALHQAVEQGNLEAVRQHIAAKSDLNKPNLAGWTPLHLAAMQGNLQIVQALVQGGADVSRKGQGGKTPLDLAKEKRQTAIVQFLQPSQSGGQKSGRGLVDGGLGVTESMGQ